MYPLEKRLHLIRMTSFGMAWLIALTALFAFHPLLWLFANGLIAIYLLADGFLLHLNFRRREAILQISLGLLLLANSVRLCIYLVLKGF